MGLFWGWVGLGWVEGVEFEGVLGGRGERVGKMMGRWKNSYTWSPGDPFGTPNTPKLSQKPYKVTPKSKKVIFLEGSLFSRFVCRNARPVFTIFGSPQGPPNLQKNVFFPKMGVLRQLFSRYLL